ncbi:SDR family oxidoreductase [Myxococcota bacterium]|nr:SDR family oxidoreductase [Myxococcota bacterium]
MGRRKVLVVGALGVIGRAIVEHLAARPDTWEVVGVSRRAPDFETRAEFVSMDLRDARGCREALSPHADASHIVYAALYEKPQLARGWLEPDHVEVNRAMLRHLLDGVSHGSLEHVTLMQGAKAYGGHLGRPVPLPSRERARRVDHNNFYFAQEDELVERAKREGFEWSVLRPQVVCGVAVGSAMNVVAGIGAYAVLSRERGLPLVHPGHPHTLTECTDARLLASAVEWVATTPGCHGETYNVTNGDLLSWRDAWSRIAEHFGMEVGAPAPRDLAEEMPHLAPLWREIARREGLRVDSLDGLIGLSWQYADLIWANSSAPARPGLLSSIKIRRSGFHDCMDSEDALLELLERMQSQGYLPQ